jgi:thioredoxin 1
MSVHEITSVSQFNEIISSNHIVAIDAWATWCGPCRAISPIFESLSQKEPFNGKIHFAKFDVDHVKDLSHELGIRAMPTFVFFKDGEKVEEVVGASPQALLSALTKILE